MKKIYAVILAFTLAFAAVSAVFGICFRHGGAVPASALQAADVSQTNTASALPAKAKNAGLSTVAASIKLAPKSKEALLMEYETGEVLFENNSTAARPIASMIKIMTLNCIYDAVEAGKINLGDKVTVSKRAASMGGSQAFLDSGSTHSVENLIRTIVICSANDSCVALAEYISGSVENFIELMNQKAKEYKLVNTHFENCTGLPVAGQFSCALDVANMMRELVAHQNFFNHSKIWMEDYKHPDGRITGLTNTNKLVRFYDGCDGGKTGFTQEAMHCLCATAKRGETRFISVVIGAPDSATRFAESSEMLNYAFAGYESKVYLGGGQKVGDVAVRGGKLADVAVVSAKKLVAFGQKGKVGGEMVVELPKKVQAPVKAGDTVGKAYVKNGETVIAETELVAANDIAKRNFWDSLKEIFK